MRIGLFAGRHGEWSSVNTMWRWTYQLLSRHHEVLWPGHPLSSHRYHDVLTAWLAKCDVILGSIDIEVLRAREELDRTIPYAGFLEGSMSRGAMALQNMHGHLRTSDVLVGNCEADEVLARRFFPDATIRTIPFGFDEGTFYPVDDETRRDVREALGVPPDGKLLLYAGRITLEKNLHTLLKVFRVVLNARPDVRLVIAGEDWFAAFDQYGVFPLRISQTLGRLMTHLGLDERHVRFVGPQSGDRLRMLYNAADLLVSLTLHHDENFGLAQIEAMACGLPVVGTAWGGLKDTIIDGVTGAHVSAVTTPTGVKVDWWQAANVIVELLARSAADQEATRRRCSAIVRTRYSLRDYGAHLTRVLHEAVTARDGAPRPIAVSAFAKEYWAAYPRGKEVPYRREGQGLELYRELIAPFAGVRTNGHARAERVCCLAAPLAMGEDGALAVNDPIYPMTIETPETHVHHVGALTRRFAERPVIAASELEQGCEDVREALRWLSQRGLILESPRGTLDLACAGGALGAPVFVIQHVDRQTDVVWLS